MYSNTPVPDDDSATAWMAEGNCRNYPPAVFFPSDGVGVDRPARSAPTARCRTSASSTRSSNASSTASGADAASVSAAAS